MKMFIQYAKSFRKTFKFELLWIPLQFCQCCLIYSEILELQISAVEDANCGIHHLKHTIVQSTAERDYIFFDQVFHAVKPYCSVRI